MDGGRALARRGLRRWGTAAVAGVLCLAGLLFAASAEVARGTDLREDDEDLRVVVAGEADRVAAAEARVAELQGRVDAVSAGVGGAAGTELSQRSAELEPASQVSPVEGPGLVVTLDDAPAQALVPSGYGISDTVVHQQDIQAVVNALWAAGAEAMGLMDQRVISTSAVRCVGSTLRLQGTYYPPPYHVRAVGDPEVLRAALEDSADVQLYRSAAADLGLTYDVRTEDSLDLPGYEGSLDLEHARVDFAAPDDGT